MGINSFIMAPEIIGSGITALASLGNSILGSSSNANLNSKNRQWQEHMADVQYQRQRDLTQDTPLLQKQGLVAAGMSPSALGGYSGNASTVSSVPSSPSSAPEFIPIVLTVFYRPILHLNKAKLLTLRFIKIKPKVTKML